MLWERAHKQEVNAFIFAEATKMLLHIGMRHTTRRLLDNGIASYSYKITLLLHKGELNRKCA